MFLKIDLTFKLIGTDNFIAEAIILMFYVFAHPSQKGDLKPIIFRSIRRHFGGVVAAPARRRLRWKTRLREGVALKSSAKTFWRQNSKTG